MGGVGGGAARGGAAAAGGVAVGNRPEPLRPAPDGGVATGGPGGLGSASDTSGIQNRLPQRGQVAWLPAFRVGTDRRCLQRGQSSLIGMPARPPYRDNPNCR